MSICNIYSFHKAQMVRFYLRAERLSIAGEAIELSPEIPAVILCTGVEKLMEDYVIDEFVGKLHELNV